MSIDASRPSKGAKAEPRAGDAPPDASAELPEAVIVGVKLPGVDEDEFDSGLAELERLVTTLGYRPSARVTQARDGLSPAAVLGEGKLAELVELTGGSGKTGPAVRRKKSKAQQRWAAEHEAAVAKKPGGARSYPLPPTSEDDHEADEADEADGDDDSPRVALVAVDHELTPSQARNLERAVGTEVLDRTGVIIEIFHRRARSRAARLQVEMARLSYLAPRVRESPSGKERQAGRGAGEAAIELDRRKIRDRLAELREQLAALEREQDVRRAQRRSLRRVALVGYTNAGKSSLMRALTGSAVEVEDRLFATLDTTVRALTPEVKPRVLVSDTVGFIKKLPHDLVASFKSTLDEALEASLLLYVVDAADPSWERQLAVVREVLADIGAGASPCRVVMNKIDRLTPERLAELRSAEPNAWFTSAHDAAKVAELHAAIVTFFESSYVGAELVVPYDAQRFVAEMHESGRVEEERYEEDGVHVRLRAEPETIQRFRVKLTGG
ncbi:MAG TPA: GTPase HflX [Polyangiaceae bacterium]|nr:GTPase HflX [Polyangiaceae bacterium]